MSPSIQLIVRVTDGSFESSLTIPVDSTKEQRDKFAQMWVEAMREAFKMNLPQEKEAGE